MSNDNGVVNSKTNFASAWKAQTMTVEFPSGRKAEMTRPNALSLMAESDAIPDVFFNLMVEAQETGKNPTEGMDAKQMRDFFKSIAILTRELAIEHFVNPRVVTEGEAREDEMSLSDVKAMDMQDKQFLVNFAMYGGDPVDALSRFRAEQQRLVDAARNGSDVQHNTVQAGS